MLCAFLPLYLSHRSPCEYNGGFTKTPCCYRKVESSCIFWPNCLWDPVHSVDTECIISVTQLLLQALDSFTVSLHSANGRHLPGVRAVQGDCQWLCKIVEISTSHLSAQCNETWYNHNLYLKQPITKEWCQPTRGHASYPTDSPAATRQGLRNSLYSMGSYPGTACCDTLY